MIVFATSAVIILVLFVLRNGEDSSQIDRPVKGSAPPQAPSVRSWQNLVRAQFAGDQKCAECHQEQYDAHQRSGHSRTATAAESTQLGRRLDGQHYTDSVRDTVFEFERRDGLLFSGIRGQDADPVFPVHWLLGSGTHAQTPVSIDPRSRLGVEFRWTWFANTGAPGLTPDHERFADYAPNSLECFGRPLDPEQAIACVGCHMTVTPPANVAPVREAFVPNVGCERCHGPRKDHIELARQGHAEDHRPLMTWDDPTAYLKQCAVCHRDETNTPTDSKPNLLARFQPYGLKLSKCYSGSDGRMSCANCHDPHDAVSHDTASYITACNTCHTAPNQTHCSATSSGQCVDCHMPKVEWHSGIFFHDHQIRIPDKQRASVKFPTASGESP